MTSHKLLKINVITDRGDGVPPRPHPGVRMRAGLGPFNTGDQPLPTSSARIQLLGIGRGHTLASPSSDGAASPRLRGTLRIKQSLQTAQKSAERGVGLLDLEALILYATAPESDYSPPRVVSSGSKCKAAGRAVFKLPASLDPHEKSLDLSPR